MGIPSIGSIVVGAPGGRSGVVLDARPLPGGSGRDRRLALRVESPVPATPQNRPPSTTDPSLAGQSISDLRAELAEAVRDRDAARPSAARTPDRLSPQDRATVEQLRLRDAQVRQEETAHAGVAGSMAGPISYVYQRGPDGRQYAVGGSVPITVRAVTGDPAEARRLGGKLAAAALAATNPSAADLAAASRAYRIGQAGPGEIRQDEPGGDVRGGALDQDA